MHVSDLWQPSATIKNLRQRAEMMQQIRQFFHQRGYWEVETPIMAHAGITDIYLSNIKATFRGKPYCLQTSPEYHMKRLLAAGSGAIFQLARVFRDDELGRWHNPEFTLLEWYQLNINHLTLMDEVDELLQSILHCGPAIRKTYRQVFAEIVDLNPFTATIEAMQDLLHKHELDNVLTKGEQDRDQYLFLLMSHVIEPALSASPVPVAVYDFPPSQAALAQISNGAAERFEFYFRGVELANGFHELTDVDAQRQRFNDDLAGRARQGLEMPIVDEFFLAALEQGLPACAGVALGVDRLLALALEQNSIAGAMAFDISRA